MQSKRKVTQCDCGCVCGKCRKKNCKCSCHVLMQGFKHNKKELLEFARKHKIIKEDESILIAPLLCAIRDHKSNRPKHSYHDKMAKLIRKAKRLARNA